MTIPRLFISLGLLVVAALLLPGAGAACQGPACEHCYEWENSSDQGGENDVGGLWTRDAQCCFVDGGGCLSLRGGPTDWYVQGCALETRENGWQCHVHNADYSCCDGGGGGGPGGLPGGGGGGSGECEIRYGEFCPMSCAFGCTLYY